MDPAEIPLKPRKSWLVRKFKSVKVGAIAAKTMRYGLLPATLVYIAYFTEPEPTWSSLLNPFF
jgi:hypothetical protein